MVGFVDAVVVVVVGVVVVVDVVVVLVVDVVVVGIVATHRSRPESPESYPVNVADNACEGCLVVQQTR